MNWEDKKELRDTISIICLVNHDSSLFSCAASYFLCCLGLLLGFEKWNMGSL